LPSVVFHFFPSGLWVVPTKLDYHQAGDL
jgi:hypothetical protein